MFKSCALSTYTGNLAIPHRLEVGNSPHIGCLRDRFFQLEYVSIIMNIFIKGGKCTLKYNWHFYVDACCLWWQMHINPIILYYYQFRFKGVLYSMLGPDLLGLTVAV